MKQPTRCSSLLLLSLLLPHTVVYGQSAAPVPTTTFTSNSPTLQLPGSLNLNAVLGPPAATWGMPTGRVQFFYGGTSPLGTSNLSVIPSTETFSAPAITGNFGNDPFGLFALSSSASKYSALGMLDYYVPGGEETGNPEITIYSGHGAGLFQTATTYQIPNSTPLDYNVDYSSIADFNHDGIPDVLLHGYAPELSGNSPTQEVYFVLMGNPDDTYGVTTQYPTPTEVISPDYGSTGGSTEGSVSEAITVDDFNGDGYPDVAYAFYSGNIGVALNVGAGQPGSFPNFTAAAPVTAPGQFYSNAIASGHFTSSGHADLVVAGLLNSPTTGISTGEIALFLGNGDGTFASPTTVAAGASLSAIATADFRKNGITDVVIASQNPGGEVATSGSILVLFGDGNGNLATSSTVALTSAPESVLVVDFNNDGYPDVLATSTDGSLSLLLNDGTGHFSTATSVGTAPGVFSMTAAGDFNGDGLSDIAEITGYSVSDSQTTSSAFEFLNSASSQATFTTAPQTLPAGAQTLTVAFPGDANFAASTSTGVPVTVTQTATTLSWAPPAAIEYGVPLGATQLNAVSSVPGTITYAPAAGAILPPGQTTITATFIPTDNFDYTGATASQAVAVTAPSLSGISPSNVNLGSANTTITVSGQGFLNGAVVEWNSTALATTWVGLNTLTAIVPSSLLANAGTATITVADPNGVAVSGSQIFTVAAAPVTAQATAPSTITAGEDSSVTLTVGAYPVPITATLTLSFTPAQANGPPDPTVVFPNNTDTETINIPANNNATIPAVDFSSGSTAGTITLTVRLTAGGADVTPTNLVPIAIAVPAAAPVIKSATLARNGESMTVSVIGLSSTRDMTEATFHFTAAPGQTLKTTDLTVQLATPFNGWYQSADSDQYGTTFLYTQPFTLDSDATNVASVSVTLSNSQGASQPVTAQ
jgi:hypothetical protein